MSIEPHVLIKQTAIKLAMIFSFIVCFFSLTILLGYAVDAEFIYRPIANGAATHPVTAILFLLFSLDLIFISPQKKMRYVLGILALLIAGVYLFAEWVEWLIPITFISELSPFTQVVEADRLVGMSNEIGVNTLLMFSLLLVSCYFRKCNQFSLSQIFAFLTLFFPLLSITGYAYQIENFHGQMSLITTILGFFLTGANLLVRSKKGVLSYLYRQGEKIQEARWKVLLSYALPFVLGYIGLQTTIATTLMSVFGLMVMMACWLGIAFVIYDTVLRADHEKQNNALIAQMNQVQRCDRLTKLLDRQVYMNELQTQLLSQHAIERSVWVMNIDIDNMKKINQHSGFAFGDRVITDMATLLKGSLPAYCFLVRFDGDSYLVVTRQANLDSIWSLAEKLRHHLNDQLYRKYQQTMTVSIGIAYQDDYEQVDFAISKAEMATVEAKKKGKNQVYFSSDKIYEFNQY